MFSVEKLVSAARANRTKTAQELVQMIQSSVFAFAGTEELRDDLTLVVLKVLPDNTETNHGDPAPWQVTSSNAASLGAGFVRST